MTHGTGEFADRLRDWIVKEIGGLTQTETLQIWTPLTTIISVTGFLIIMVLSTILPMA